ncbi:MAG: hypothetical protein AB3N14_15820, partial [Flavobacteriaceae bacterium]
MQFNYFVRSTLIKQFTLGIFILAIYSSAFGQVKVIFDTDFGGDADDLGALAMLNHFKNKGEVELMGVMCW